MEGLFRGIYHMANSYFTQFFYTRHVMPVLLDCNFVVAASDAAGFGITGLKGQGIDNVYMHTSATPAVGNPNPANGVIMVKLSANFNRYFGGFSQIASALTTAQTTTTANVAYVISALGTATLAQWQAVGLPLGLTPTIGQAFIATATGTIGGSATVQPTATTGSNIDHIEILGNPNTTLAPTGNRAYLGATLIYQCFKAQALQAPTDGSLINLAFYLSNSSVLVKGE